MNLRATIPQLEGYLQANISVAPGFVPAMCAQLDRPDNIFATGNPIGYERCVETLDRFEAGEIPPVGLLRGLSDSLTANFHQMVRAHHGEHWQPSYISKLDPTRPISRHHPTFSKELQELAQPNSWVDQVGYKINLGQGFYHHDRTGLAMFLKAIGKESYLNLGNLVEMVFREDVKIYLYDFLWLLSANFLMRGEDALGVHLTTYNPEDRLYGSTTSHLTPLDGAAHLIKSHKRPLEISVLRRQDIMLHGNTNLHPLTILLHDVFHTLSLARKPKPVQNIMDRIETILLNLKQNSNNPFFEYALGLLYDAPMSRTNELMLSEQEAIDRILRDINFFLKDMDISLPRFYTTDECQQLFGEFKDKFVAAMLEEFNHEAYADTVEIRLNQLRATQIRFQRYFSA